MRLARPLVTTAAGACLALVVVLHGGSAFGGPDPVFTATPLTNSSGGSETVAATDGCPAPAGAGDWIAIVKVAQGANPEISYQDFSVAADGSWGGPMALPEGLATGPAQLVASCFDASHVVTDSVEYATIDLSIVATPPTSSAPVSSGAPPTPTSSAPSSPSASTPARTTSAVRATPTSALASSTASAPAASSGTLPANTGFPTAPVTGFAALAVLVGAMLAYAARAGQRGRH